MGFDNKGFIRLNRKFFENVLWKEPREYSRAEAWLDLIQSARFDSSKAILGDRVIDVQKGEVVASRRFLEKRWGWGSTKVNNFLRMLELESMIIRTQTSGQTIITLCNYALYNDAQTSEQTTDKPQTNQTQTTDKPKIKKEKKEENYFLSPTCACEAANFENSEAPSIPVNSESVSTSPPGCAAPPIAGTPQRLESIHELSARYRRKGFPQQEAVMRAVPTHCHTHDDVWMWLDRFVVELVAKEQLYKTWEDFTSHFINWLQTRKITPQTNERQSSTNNFNKTGVCTQGDKRDLSGVRSQFANSLITAQQKFEQAMAGLGELEPEAANFTPKIPDHR